MKSAVAVDFVGMWVTRRVIHISTKYIIQITFTKEQCEKYHVTVLDRGEKISKRDMDEIFHHPWDEQKQKQKELRRSQAMDKYGGIENNEQDIERQL